MTAQLTIIGLGQIGASIGMALGEKKAPLKRVGFDKDTAVANAARALGAVDEIQGLSAAVKAADILLFCLPLSQINDVLKKIGREVREGAIVMDTAPLKSPLLKWWKEFIPEGRHYLGLVPAITSEALADPDSGLKAARPDLFKRTVMVVGIPPGTGEAVELFALTFVKWLGAKPMLTDLAESDGMMASAHILPQIAAAGLLDATVDQPGWADARKLAGRPFVTVTGGLAHYDDPASLGAAALSNPAAVIHALDVLIASLRGLRDDIEAGDAESVHERLEHALAAREHWLDERGAAAWLAEGGDQGELPNVGEQMMQMLFGNRILDRNKRGRQNVESRK